MSKRIILITVIAALCFATMQVGATQARVNCELYGTNREALGGVTNIKEVVNKTSGIVQLFKTEITGRLIDERHETTGVIPANGTWSGDMWVPWANNSGEFNSHYMEIFIQIPDPMRRGDYLGTTYYVWQSGEYVRFTDRQKFVDNAPKVSGEARAGGDRRLLITTDGKKVGFALEKYE